MNTCEEIYSELFFCKSSDLSIFFWETIEESFEQSCSTYSNETWQKFVEQMVEEHLEFGIVCPALVKTYLFY